MKTSYSIGDIARVISPSETLIKDDTTIISKLSFDSRNILSPSKTLFFAIKGVQDGHKFIESAYKQGVRNFVISDSSFINKIYKANFLVVKNTIQSLQLLAQSHRDKFNLPVIGITGSNGKTIIKEWLYTLLSPDFQICKSPKSYNSQIGVAISVSQLDQEDQLGIFEAGISTINEMNNLQKMIKPSIGILSNIGSAHSIGFKDNIEKLKEKLLLFSECEVLIYSPEFIPTTIKNIYQGKTFSVSFNDPSCDLYIYQTNTDYKLNRTKLIAQYKQETIDLDIPFTDQASIQNISICWATLLYLAYNNSLIAERIQLLHKLDMRLELKTGKHNCTIIDDSYMCDFASLKIALDFLQQQNQHDKKSLILSDILENNTPAKELYTEIVDLIKKRNIHQFYGIGVELFKHQELFSKSGIDSYFFETTTDFLDAITSNTFSDETILIKGGRDFKFELISQELTEKKHQTVLQINLNAILNNLNTYRKLLPPTTKTMAMVKAFSYGSGTFEIANLLQHHKVDYLAVAYPDEGVMLKEAGIALPIMVMNTPEATFDTLVSHNLEPEIYSHEQLNAFTTFLKNKNIKNYPIHLKIDTGMHRLGFNSDIDTIESLALTLKNQDIIRIKSVLSHLVGSDEAIHDHFSEKQIETFKQACEILKTNLNYNFIRHICNSSGIVRFPEAHFDMVRLGIGLYGIDPSEEKTKLQNVATLRSSVSQVKEIPSGESIGYSRKGLMPNGGKTATVQIGYADGYLRKLGNGNGKMFINGVEVKTIGNICMDMCMVDVTNLNNVKVGDEVEVFGENISIESIAQTLETIPYEILTNVSQRVKRIYYFE